MLLLCSIALHIILTSFNGLPSFISLALVLLTKKASGISAMLLKNTGSKVSIAALSDFSFFPA
jgi:hypothetical protein